MLALSPASLNAHHMIRTLAAMVLGTLAAQGAVEITAPTFKEWQSAIAKLPPNREIRDKEKPPKKLLPLQDFKDFEKVLDAFIESQQSGPIAKAENWVGQTPDFTAFFSTTPNYYRDAKVPFHPFVQKLTFPAGSKVIIQGDMHGDVRSLMTSIRQLQKSKVLEGFKVVDPTAHLCFTGDFTDRGAYGTEVLYTLFRLKLANPAQVHIGRGNHEDFGLNSRYGFLEELRSKFGQEVEITKLMRAYDLLPIVMYVGTESDFVQMNHGGMEPGFDPRGILSSTGSERFQLLGTLKQKTFHTQHPGWLGDDAESQELADKRFRDFTPKAPVSLGGIGFCWNDFTVFADEPALRPGRPFTYGQAPTQFLLKNGSTEKQRLRAVIRAHQHSGSLNPLMSRLVASNGIFRHWQDKDSSAHAKTSPKELAATIDTAAKRPIPDGSVWTFNVSPDSGYGKGCKFDFVTVGVMTLQKDFNQWSMQVLATPVF